MGVESSSSLGPSEAEIQSPEDEKSVERRKLLERIYGDWIELGLYPQSLIQGGNLIEYADENLGAVKGRPFAVVQVIRQDPSVPNALLEEMIYKVRTEKDPNRDGWKEIMFLRTIAPWFHEQLPEDLRSQIAFPDVIDSRDEGDYTFCLQEYIEGEISGTVWDVKPEVLTKESLETTIRFIRSFHEILTLENVQALEPNMPVRQTDIYRDYENYINWKQIPIPGLLGEEYFEKMRNQLEESRDLIAQAPLQFTANDINPANIIKMADGRLGMIDWERAHTVKDPAKDYGFVLADLWADPELQKYYYERVVAENQDIPHFAEFLRLDFIYRHSPAPINHFLPFIDNPDESIRSYARRAVEQTCQNLKDAIDQKGMWAQKGHPNNET